jgi:hypothetical protein
MHYALVLVAAASFGVDVGWQPTRDGGFEYIIQIEPELLESLLDGQEIISDIPAFLQGVRTYRIRVGTDHLPQEGAPAKIEPADSDAPAAADAAPAPAPAPSADPTPPSGESPPAGDRSFNESVAPEKPVDAAPAGPGTPSNERAPPEPAPAAGASAGDDGPSLLDQDDVPSKSPADRFAERQQRYLDRTKSDEATSPEGLDARPSLEAPKTRQKPPALPDTFVADDETRPLVNHAGYRDDDGPTRLAASGSLFDAARSQQDKQSGRADSTAPAASRTNSTKPPQRPWMALTMALLGLFASMGGNCFLGWLSWGFRERYLKLLDERKYMQRLRRRNPSGDEGPIGDDDDLA